jgi:hypothetical protein
MGEERNVYKVLIGKPEGKRPLGRPRRKREDGIRMDLREIDWGSVEWTQLAQDRDRWRGLMNMVMNLGLWRHEVSCYEYVGTILTLRSPHGDLT